MMERLMKQFLLVSPLYSRVYDKVWLWSEFPYNGNQHDLGIDLVAHIRGQEDDYCAIQVKFYEEGHSVQKADVDTFLSASGKPFYINGQPVYFQQRLIVSTTDKWSSTAENTILGQRPPVNRIRLKDLQDSGIDWDSFTLSSIESMKQSPQKQPRPHQKEAIEKVITGFQSHDRGKLIMACGTGKTLTGLKITEKMTAGYGSVLVLVPSISLLNQTLSEWAAQCSYPYSVFGICSDPKASKITEDEIIDTMVPATTNVEALCHQYNESDKNNLQLFFSTYQSINVIHDFQKKSGVQFDLVICDEAHRTTGVTLAGEDDSNFVRVHDNEYIRAKKRLYMTATPRIYADASKQKAKDNSALLCSMDDENIYGPEFYRLSFSDAVLQGLLSDYKVIVLAVDEEFVSRSLQKQLTDNNNELTLDDAVKIVGCMNGLAKKTHFPGEENYFANDPQPMRRAVAFTQTIEQSKKFVAMFEEIQALYKINTSDGRNHTVELKHVDGGFNALERKNRIEWLKQDAGEDVCRVLSNARCLSEGVDVPALDAVMFLNPRKSIVDIIQSVGRVMRKSESKQYGYIILPIGISAGVEPEVALADNEKYKIVWDVLQALRAHDDRFNNTINRIELNKNKPDNINIIGVTGGDDGDNDYGSSGTGKGYDGSQLSFDMTELEQWKNNIYAKIVKKCGSRQYWENWAKDIAEIAARHIAEIKVLIEQPDIAPKFDEFLQGLRRSLNPSIDKDDAIEMLAEHLITKPVFDALFDNYSFLKSNPVSRIMQNMLDVLNDNALEKEQETLDKFYASVQERAKGIDNAEGKQKIIIELYEIHALTEVAEGTKLEIPVLLASFYGLRRSEVLGLKWDAIDFEANTLEIKHIVTQASIDGKKVLVQADRAKTKSSLRTLPLVPPIRDRLLMLKGQQDTYRRLCGKSYNRDYLGYLCVDEIGNIIRPNYVSEQFPKLLEKNGLRPIRFHDLRHSCASLLLANGVPMKQIQEWLGHSDFSTTANIYAHLDYASKLSSAQAMLEGLGYGNASA